MGADKIFNIYSGAPCEQVVPLSISHGIDFGHCYGPMDITSIEPIHWSYNEYIHRDAIKIKPSLLAPHPWAMIVEKRSISVGAGTLIIGPPPGVENDMNLLHLIKDKVFGDTSILIKARGNYIPSIEFWRCRGITPICANNLTNHFYLDLFDLISKYRTIIGCYFSSALIFAASIGKDIELIRGYRYETYDTQNYLKKINFDSDRARSIVQTFLLGDQQKIQISSRELLGMDMALQSKKILAEYLDLIKTLRRPFYSTSGSLSLMAKQKIAMIMQKPGVINLSIPTIMHRLIKKKIIKKEIDELSIWADSPNSNNLMITPVPYKKGITEPGNAVSQY